MGPRAWQVRWVPNDRFSAAVLAAAERVAFRYITRGTRPNNKHVFSSERFMWVLYQNRRPQELHDASAEPSWALRQVIEKTLPLYSVVLPRFPPLDLLQDSAWVADLAYVRAVWAYSSVLGKRVFPHGLHAWPPDAEAFFQLPEGSAGAPAVAVADGNAGSPPVAKM